MQYLKRIILSLLIIYGHMAWAMQALLQKQQQITRQLYDRASQKKLDLDHYTRLKNGWCAGAAVLPITYYLKEGIPTLYVILGQENAGPDMNLWDAFGGATDTKKDPLGTAARECEEEMISEKTLGSNWNDMYMKQYIDLPAGHTKAILARHITDIDKDRSKPSFYTTYITEFSAGDITSFRNNFYAARNNATQLIYKEKKSIAVVRWDDLVTAIRNIKKDVLHPKSGQMRWNYKDVQVSTYIIDQQGRELIRSPHITSTLREILVKMLHPFIIHHNADLFSETNKVHTYARLDGIWHWK